MTITLNADEFITLFKLASRRPITSEDRQDLTEAVSHICDRDFPELAPAALNAWQEASLTLIDKGTEPSEESKALYETILRVFGKNATGEDLIRFGNAMIKKSEDDEKN